MQTITEKGFPILGIVTCIAIIFLIATLIPTTPISFIKLQGIWDAYPETFLAGR